MNEIRIKNSKSIKDRNKVRINTNFMKDQVEYVEEYPLGENEDDRQLRKIYKYYCPICLRYFNHILISDFWGHFHFDGKTQRGEIKQRIHNNTIQHTHIIHIHIQHHKKIYNFALR